MKFKILLLMYYALVSTLPGFDFDGFFLDPHLTL